MSALNVLCAQLARDLFAIAKFLSCSFSAGDSDLRVFLSKSLKVDEESDFLFSCILYINSELCP